MGQAEFKWRNCLTGVDAYEARRPPRELTVGHAIGRIHFTCLSRPLSIGRLRLDEGGIVIVRQL